MFTNHGVLEGKRPTDYTANELVGALPYEERNPSGDWTPYLPQGERQYSNPSPGANGDSMSCVSFSALNSIEMQEIQQTGNVPNYSDRFIAKMSGTTVEGNYLWKVADTIRQLGLVNQSDYDYPPTPFTFNQFHANIPEPLLGQLLAKGKAWLDTWSISYEWIEVSKASFLKHLKHAPLQVIIPGHAIVAINCPNDVIDYFDSYEHGSSTDFTATKPLGQVTSALKIVLTSKSTMNQTRVVLSSKDNNTVWLCTPVSTMEVLQERAGVEGFVIPTAILNGDKPNAPKTADL